MNQNNMNEIMSGVLVDDVALTLEELARACAVEPAWIIERVSAGFVVGPATTSVAMHTSWRFTSAEIVRTRRLAAMERDFDANPELAALVADLIEEVERLKRAIRSAGLAADYPAADRP